MSVKLATAEILASAAERYDNAVIGHQSAKMELAKATDLLRRAENEYEKIAITRRLPEGEEEV